MKKVTICGNEKPLSEYTPRKDRPCGYYSRCKECDRKRSVEYRKKGGGKLLKHTKNGLVNSIMKNQRKSCKIRGQEMPTYTLDELKSWVFSQPNFQTLFNAWAASGFDKWKKPSIDRIDEKLSYNFSNIRLVTWRENLDKQSAKHKAGINTKSVKQHREVKATHLVSGETLFFNSMSSAERYFRAKGLPAYQGSISAVCRGRNKKHLNYKWEYVDDNKC